MDWLKRNGLGLLVHVGGWVPLVVLVWAYAQNSLGLDPVRTATRRAGRYALVFLLLSLVPTLALRLFGFRDALRVRRSLGLYATLNALAHLTIYVWLDYGLQLRFILQSIAQGPFVLVGLGALIILLLLAITSTDGWVRRLGRNWSRLHRLTYVAAVLVVIHFAWSFKELRVVPMLYGLVLILLLVARIPPISKTLRLALRRT